MRSTAFIMLFFFVATTVVCQTNNHAGVYALKDSIVSPLLVRHFNVDFSGGGHEQYYYEWIDRIPEMLNVETITADDGLVITLNYYHLNQLTLKRFLSKSKGISQ